MKSTEESDLKRKGLLRGIRYATLPFLLGCLVVLSLLAGCQLQNILLATQTPASQPTLQQATSSLPEVQATPSSVSTQNTQTRLVLWVSPEFDPGKDTQAAKLFNARITAFQSVHAEVIIEVRVKALEGRGGLLDSLTTASSAAPKALPALVLLSTDDLENAALKELLLPLDKAYKGYSDTDWLPYAAQMSKIADVNYGVPVAGDALVMAYRPLQSPFPPTTWQELSMQNLAVAFPAADDAALVATTLYLESNGKLTGETGAPLLQKTPLLKAFALVNDATQTGSFPYWLTQFSSFDQSWQSFKNQQAGYSINWASQYLIDQPANVLISSMPKVGTNQVTLSKGWVWCIPSQSTHQPYSIELLNFFSDPEFIDQWGQAAGYLPVRQSGLDLWKNNELSPIITTLVQNAQNPPALSITHITNPILESSFVQVIKKQVYYQQAVDDAVKNFSE